jgi:hypothetical protein
MSKSDHTPQFWASGGVKISQFSLALHPTTRYSVVRKEDPEGLNTEVRALDAAHCRLAFTHAFSS